MPGILLLIAGKSTLTVIYVTWENKMRHSDLLAFEEYHFCRSDISFSIHNIIYDTLQLQY